MAKQDKKEMQKVFYPHPYIMDPPGVEKKLAIHLMQDTEKLKDMIREFTRYHAFCFHARELLSCNIDQIASGKSAHPYPPIPLPGFCKDDNKPWREPEKQE